MQKAGKAVEPIYLLGMALLLIARLGLQVVLYHSGFQALAADEFGRTTVAAYWALKPYAIWDSAWLPFYFYMFGAALKLNWELLWVPRAIVIAFGFVSIALMYRLSKALFDSRRVGFISAILLAVNPVHVWLSSTPLTELLHTTLVLAFLLGSTLYLKSEKRRYICFSALSLAIANGFRFEAWMISGLFSLWVAGGGILGLRRGRRSVRQTLPLLIGALLPWGFPIAWMTASYANAGNPLASLAFTRAYNATWYGNSRDFYAYLRALFATDPYLTVLTPVALVACLARHWSSKAVRWAVAMAAIPLSIITCLLGGQPQPPANRIRYLASFVFVFYPMFACLLNLAVERFLRSRLARMAFLIVAILIMVFTQTHATFQFVNDPAAGGLAVGKRIRALRIEHPEWRWRPVLIELSYWQYMAIHVGANDVSYLIYDRQFSEDHQSPSLFLSDLDAVRKCLAIHKISHIVVQSPELKAVIEREMGLPAFGENVNHYSFYQVPDMYSGEGEGLDDSACPLGKDVIYPGLPRIEAWHSE